MSVPLPKLSRRKRGWQQGDPPVSRGKSVSQRKSARDGGLTPSERAQKDKLMRQFQRMPEGQSGNSRAYVESPVWCHCGRLNGSHIHLASPETQRELEEMGRESFERATRGSRRR